MRLKGWKRPQLGQPEGTRPKLRKGDEVLVINGKDRGRRGKVVEVNAKKWTAIIEHINEYKKHQKATRANETSGIITIAMPIHISNVMVIDKSSSRPSRVGRKHVGEEHLRYAKRSGQLIDSKQ